MPRFFSALVRGIALLPVAVVSFASPALRTGDHEALAATNPVDFVVENLDGSQFVYVVFHALDRDGFCSPPEGALTTDDRGLPVFGEGPHKGQLVAENPLHLAWMEKARERRV